MVADVKGTTSGVVNAAVQRPAACEAGAVKPSAQTNPVSGENVHLTKTAAEMHELEQAVRSAPDIDVERVNTIRLAIAEGNYHIDNDKLAEKLMRHEMMMSSPGGAAKK